MNNIQIIVATSAVALAIWIACAAYRKRLSLSYLCKLLTVYGVVIGVVIIFEFSPRIVEVTPTPRLIIHSVSAVDDRDEARSYGTTVPAAYCRGRISNIGNALAYGRALAITSGTILSNTEPYRILVAYLFDDSVPEARRHFASLEWRNQDQSERLVPVDSQWILRLPPIPPNSSVIFVIGFRVGGLRSDGETQVMNSIITNGLDLTLIQAPSESVTRTKLHATFENLEWVTVDCPYPPPREP